jgi:hypothetical protein
MRIRDEWMFVRFVCVHKQKHTDSPVESGEKTAKILIMR